MTQSSPAVEDFDTIKNNLERIRKEREDATKNGIDISPKPEQQGTDAYYPSYYAQSGGTTLGYMDMMLDEDDLPIKEQFPNNPYSNSPKFPVNRVLS